MQPIVKLSFFQHRSEIIDYDHVFNQCILLYFLTFNCGISYKRCINFLYKSSKFMKEVSKKNNSILSEFGASFDIDENETVAFYLASTVSYSFLANSTTNASSFTEMCFLVVFTPQQQHTPSLQSLWLVNLGGTILWNIYNCCEKKSTRNHWMRFNSLQNLPKMLGPVSKFPLW